MPTRLTIAQARRMALAAQGFADPEPAGRVDIRHLRRVMGRTGLFQIDSVNVLQRAHYLPAFSRLGTYKTQLLDDATYRRREFFEYWVHEASIVPVNLHPLLRHRMNERGPGRRAASLMQEAPGYIDQVLDEVADTGPLAASDLRDPGSSSGSWWGWSKGKVALEHLFSIGRIAVAKRPRFVRHYDLTERVLPDEVLREATPPPAVAQRELVRRASRHLGVATVDDLADYYRLPMAPVRSAVRDLLASGELREATVEGWAQPAYVAPDAHIPRRIHAATVLSPFDPVVFHRPRALRLFHFHYRIEIYVPKDQRVFGYYVLPFLHGDRIVGRVDLKADRATSRLLVHSAWWEEDTEPTLATPWWAALRRLAQWLALDDIVISDHGTAAAHLREVAQ